MSNHGTHRISGTVDHTKRMYGRLATVCVIATRSEQEGMAWFGYGRYVGVHVAANAWQAVSVLIDGYFAF